MHDGKVISACIASREAYDKVAQWVDLTEFSPLAQFWWPIVDDWYKADASAAAADPEIIREKGKRRIDPKHVDTMLGYFDEIPGTPSPANVVNELLEVKRHAAGNQLAHAIASGARTPELEKALVQYNELFKATTLEAQSKIQHAAALADLDEEISSEHKITLSPESLNRRTDGGALPGDFIIVFGRPEVGKTLFCVNLVAHWLRAGKKVLYVGNEDNVNKIKHRVRLNLANMSKEQVERWTDEANSRAAAAGIDDRLVMVHLHPGTPREIEELIVEHKPDCLVIDQLRNVGGAAGDNITQRLNQIAIDIRQLLSKYELVGLGVAQAHAGEHGKPKRWLDNDDIDSSRTGLPAQGDLIVGIGALPEDLDKGERALSLCKNKMSGDHTGLVVKFDIKLNKVRD